MYTAIIAAMSEEIALIHQDLVVTKQERLAGRIIYIGTLYGAPVVLAVSNLGKVAAALTTSLMLSRYPISQCFYVGTAGAADPNLEIGDIVVSDCLVQYDMDASPLFPKHEIPVLGKAVFTAPPKLVKHIREAGAHYLQRDLPTQITKEQLLKFNIKQPKIVTGTVASGDLFVSDPKVLQNIIHSISSLNVSTLCCIEMESAAAAQVCHEFEVPFLTIRTISDKADHSALIDFTRFISEVGSYYLHGVIRQALQMNIGKGIPA